MYTQTIFVGTVLLVLFRTVCTTRDSDTRRRLTWAIAYGVHTIRFLSIKHHRGESQMDI